MRAWIGYENAVLYSGDTGPDRVLTVPRFTRVTVLRAGDDDRRAEVEIGKGPEQEKVANRSTFEAAHNRVHGWMDEDDLREEFPLCNTFDIPDFADTLPRLYHGSHKEAIDSITLNKFTVGMNPAVGRSLGDAVYATPYVSQAAVHAFGSAQQAGKATFQVALLKFLPVNTRGTRILVHDRVRESELMDHVDGDSTAVRARRVLERMHPAALVHTAVQLAGKYSVTAQEITAAARVHNYDVVLYSGYPGDNIYCLLRVSDWEVESVVLQDAVSTASRSQGLEDLDWFHRATVLDEEQEFRNRHGRW